MDDQDLRSRNRSVGLAVLAGMLALAALTATYALMTMPYRRQVDLVQPDARPLKTDLMVVLGLTTIAVAISTFVFRWLKLKSR
jgi:hypothetical protein